jgi:hypothetical protein
MPYTIENIDGSTADVVTSEEFMQRTQVSVEVH